MKKSITKTSDESIRYNLDKWMISASPENWTKGRYWYRDAQDYCKALSNEFDINPYICASVVSCLSPNNKWQRNKIDARAVIIAHLNGIDPENVKVCTYTANKLKAFRVLRDGEKIASTAPKTHAFAMNCGLLSNNHITIDKWHIRACLSQPGCGIIDCVETITSAQYRRVEAITAGLAKIHGLKGYQFQAIIWLTIKENWNR